MEAKLWKDMTPEEKGALLLAHHEGKVIEWSYFLPWETDNSTAHGGVPRWGGDCAYRVRPEPVVETVTLYGGYAGGAWGFESFKMATDTHKLTLTIIDGEVQPVATVEKL
jgi:hypothetical protein